MSIRIIKRNPSAQDKEVILEIDPIGGDGNIVKTHSVKGKITDDKGVGLENKIIQAFDVKLVGDAQSLGNSVTSGENGDYILYYNSDDAGLGGKLFADLVVKVYAEGTSVDPDGTVANAAIPESTSSTYVDALENEEVNFVISSVEYSGPSQFKKIGDAVLPLLDLDTIDIEQLSEESKEILSTKIQMPLKDTLALADARLLHKLFTQNLTSNDNSPFISSPSVHLIEGIYGMIKCGLDRDPISFMAASRKEKESKLNKAVQSGFISKSWTPTQVTVVLDQLDLQKVAKLYQFLRYDEQANLVETLTDFAQVLKHVGLSMVDCVTFNQYYNANVTDRSESFDFWGGIDSSLTGYVTGLRKILSLYGMTGEFKDLSTYLYDHLNAQTGSDQEIDFLATWDEPTWYALFSGASPTIEIPHIENPTDEQKHDLAAHLTVTFQGAFPERPVADEINSTQTGSDLDLFFQNNNALPKDDRFNFISSPTKFFNDNTSIFNGIASENVDAVKEDVHKYTRLIMLLEGENKFAKAKALDEEAGLNSATKICRKGRRAFVKLAGTLSTPMLGAEARRVFKRAVRQMATVSAIQGLTSQTINGLGPTVVPTIPTPTTGQLASNPELSILFGSQDVCDCEHCRSSQSPAAYLVDVLDYLQSSENVIVGQDSVWLQLMARRPEFGGLEASCENTNRLIPYIDLVNEVLEQAIMVQNGQPGLPTRQTSYEADVLRVNPEHLQSLVYDDYLNTQSHLSNLSRYSRIKPFNAWDNHAAHFLNIKGINRGLFAQLNEGSEEGAISVQTAKTILGIPAGFDAQLTETISVLFDANSASLKNVKTLMDHTLISYEELGLYLDTNFINSAGLKIHFLNDSCSLDQAEISDGADPSPAYWVADDFVHLLLFHRTNEYLGWSVSELDTVLSASSLGASNLNDNFFIRAAQLSLLSENLRLPISDVASFYTPLSEIAYGDDLSQFDQVFANPKSTIQLDFSSTIDLTGDDFKKVRQILQLDSDELERIVSNLVSVPSAATKADVSNFHAIKTFCKALRISIDDYLDWTELVANWSPLGADPADTLQFLKWHEALTTAGLDLESLRYLFLDDFSSNTQSTPEGIQEFVALIRTVIDEKFQEIGVSNSLPYDADQNIRIANKYALIAGIFNVFFNPGVVSRSLEILKASNDEAADGNFLEQNWAEVVDVNSAKASLTISGGLASEEDRLNAIISLFHQGLFTKLELEDLIVLTASQELDGNPEIVRGLLWSYIQDGSNNALGELISSEEFIYDVMAQNPPDVSGLVLTFQKVILVLTRLQIENRSLDYVMSGTGTTGWQDLTDYSSFGFQPLVKLARAANLDLKFRQSDFSIIQLLENEGGETQEDLITSLAIGTGWDRSFVSTVTSHFSYSYPADFSTEEWINKSFNVIATCDSVGCDPGQLFDWSARDLTFGQSQDLVASIRSSYSEEKWQSVAIDSMDQVRRSRRDALVQYLLATDLYQNTNEMYEHFLLDVEMSSCFMTSRIKNAISSLQLWVQRITMNLEPTIAFSDEDASEWKWRKYYRVWEAGRKVFLYPENWIEPELRDDKSSFFEELEDELLQDEVNDQNVEKAYRNYLTKLDETAHLEITGLFNDEESNTLHVFGRTKDAPQKYYHREWQDEQSWTSWTSIDLDIEGDHLIPTVFNNRLAIFWPVITVKTRKVQSFEDRKKQEPVEYQEIKMAYSYFQNGKWHPKTLSNRFLESDGDLDESKLHFSVAIENGELGIDTYKLPNLLCRGHFKLSDCSSELQAISGVEFGRRPGRLSNASRSGMFLTGVGPVFNTQERNIDLLEAEYVGEITPGYQLPKTINTQTIFHNVPSTYRIAYPSDERSLLSNGSFFYSDANHTFFVHPSKEFYSREVEEEIQDHFTTDTEVIIHSIPELGVVKSWAEFYVASNNKIIDTLDYDSHEFDSGHDDKTQNGTYYHGGHYGGRSNDDIASDFIDQYSSVIDREVDRLADFVNNTSVPPKSNSGSQSIQELENYVDSHSQFGNDTFISILARAGFYNHLDFSTSIAQEGHAVDLTLTGTAYFKKYKFYGFYHRHVCTMISQLNRHGLDGLLSPPKDSSYAGQLILQAADSGFDFNLNYLPDQGSSHEKVVYPKEVFDFGIDSPYGLYNWELFFHIPMSIAGQLSQNQKFEEAQKWYHHIFNPTETEGVAPKRYWRFAPFHHFHDEFTVQQLITSMENGSPELARQVSQWEKTPFQPHAIARLRTGAYMKNVVMKYIDNLIAWGDQLFRRDSIESITEATHLYILAGQILGPKPELVQKEDAPVMDLTTIFAQPELNLWEQVESEIGQPTANESEKIVTPDDSLSSLTSLLFFGTAPNAKLLEYWDTVADRLFKIRHCQNIEGVTRQLALFQPPIDPALLVKAAAAGLDFGAVLDGLSASTLPHYRFRVLIQKANEICSDVRSLGQSLLSALEKRDAEELSLLRASQEVNLLKAIREVKKQAIEEGKESLDALSNALAMAVKRVEFYDTREYMNSKEKKQLKKLDKSSKLQIAAEGSALLATIVSNFPDIKSGVAGLGALFSIGKDADAIANGLRARAEAFSFLSHIESNKASMAGIKGGYDRRKDEWELQLSLAEQEVEQVTKQITAAEIRLAISERELENHDMQAAQSDEVKEFMKYRYTNRDLYNWMVTQISSIYFKSYQLAFDVAKMAERAFGHELARSADFIQFGHWDSLKKGLLSGERLQADLRRMEVAYLEQNKREYEITKHVPLSLLSPDQLIRLRESGECEFFIPEVLYDLDHAGQYLRRIKSVRLTIPGVTGPYTNINGKLTLLESRTRKNTNLKDSAYVFSGGVTNDDDRFDYNIGGIQSIATSNAQNDGGLFELNFQDERYLPFEGAGAISNWNLKLGSPSSLRNFDYDTISDVIVHISYTARDGGDGFRTTVEGEIQDGLNNYADWIVTNGVSLSRLFSMKTHFPNALHDLLNSGTASFDVSKNHFAHFLNEKVLKSTRTMEVKIQPKSNFNGAYGNVSVDVGSSAILSDVDFQTPTGEFPGASDTVESSTDVVDSWTITLAGGAFSATDIEDIFIVLNHTVADS